LESTDAILDHGSCLTALAAVRRAKWFQVRILALFMRIVKFKLGFDFDDGQT